MVEVVAEWSSGVVVEVVMVVVEWVSGECSKGAVVETVMVLVVEVVWSGSDGGDYVVLKWRR